MSFERVQKFVPVLRALEFLTDKQISAIFQASAVGKENIIFPAVCVEIANNISIIGAVPLEANERASLKKYSKELLQIAAVGSTSLKRKTQIFANNPKLIALLAKVILKHIS